MYKSCTFVFVIKHQKMKNSDYIKKYNLGFSAEVGDRPIDDKFHTTEFFQDIYFDYKSLLEFLILKGSITINSYDSIYGQMKIKLDGLSKKTPFGLPDSFYDELTDFYYNFMKEYYKEYFDRIIWFQNGNIEEVYDFINDVKHGRYGIDTYYFKQKYVDNVDKFNREKQIAIEILFQRLTERDKKIREDEDRNYSEQSNFFGFNFFANLFLNFNKCPTESFMLLGISTKSTELEVKSQYRKVSMSTHPDRGGNTDRFISYTEAKEKCLKFIESQY